MAAVIEQCAHLLLEAHGIGEILEDEDEGEVEAGLQGERVQKIEQADPCTPQPVHRLRWLTRLLGLCCDSSGTAAHATLLVAPLLLLRGGHDSRSDRRHGGSTPEGASAGP